jgi:bifunctional DNase/RNase
MNNQVREVQVKAVLPLEGSFAVFLGTDEKTFVIYVDEPVGTAISMFMRGISKERPLTHDLLASVLMAFGGKVERVVINDVEGSVFYARLIISAENQLGARKVIELDARPSDSIAMAMQQGAPVYVADKVWQSVEDVSEALEQVEKRNQEASSSNIVDESEEDDEDDEGEEEELEESDEEEEGEDGEDE